MSYSVGRGLSSFPSVPPAKFRKCTAARPLQFLSKSFLINDSSVILIFDAIQCPIPQPAMRGRLINWIRFGWKWSQSSRCTVPKLSLETQRRAMKNRTAEQPAGIPTHRLPSTSTERQCGTHRRNLLWDNGGTLFVLTSLYEYVFVKSHVAKAGLRISARPCSNGCDTTSVTSRLLLRMWEGGALNISMLE